MELQYLVPSNLEEKLKCFICKNYLSYFPISTTSNGHILCGRCTAPEDITFFKDEAFETLCQSVKFPCRYHSEGCLEELVPKEVPQHEKTCSFRQFKCVSTKPHPCKWSGPLPTLLKHCQDKHSNIFLKEGEFEIDLTRSEEQDYFMEYEDVLVIFAKKFNCDNKKLICALYSNQYQFVGGTSCQLSVRFGKTTISQELNLTSYEAQTFSELVLQDFCTENQNELVVGKICIGEVQSTKDGNERDLANNENEYKILSALTCSRCHKMATPPFYRCPTGSISLICSSCKQSNYTTCCKNSKISGDACDYTLTSIVKLTKCHCSNEANGCSYTANYVEMRAHDKLCQYVKVNCILHASCPWTGPVKDAVDHILADHQELLTPSGIETKMTSQDTAIKCKFVKVREFLFKLSYRVTLVNVSYTPIKTKKRFTWSVQMMRNYKEKFKYQIDVSDGESGGRVSLWQFCTPLTKQESVFLNSDQYCYLEMEQLRMLKPESKDDPNEKKAVVVQSDPYYMRRSHGMCTSENEDDLSITFKVRIYK